jgi:hypothetical protein
MICGIDVFGMDKNRIDQYEMTILVLNSLSWVQECGLRNTMRIMVKMNIG